MSDEVSFWVGIALVTVALLLRSWRLWLETKKQNEERKVMIALASADTQHAVDDASMRKALGHIFRIGDTVVLKAGKKGEVKDDDGNVYPLDGVDATVVRVVSHKRFCGNACCFWCCWREPYKPLKIRTPETHWADEGESVVE